MIKVWGVLLLAVLASGCPPMQNVPVDGSDPSVGYLRNDVDKMHEKLAQQADSNTRVVQEVKRLEGNVSTNSGRITRVDERVTTMLIDIGEVRARMELLEGSRKLSDRTIAFLQMPIEFNYGTEEMQKAGRRRVEVTADFLDVNRDVQVVVVGFLPPGCPTIDAPECGEDPLVQRRSQVVRSRLEKSGVASDRIAEEYVELPRGMQRDDVYVSIRTEGETPPPPTPRPTPVAPEPRPAGTADGAPAPGAPAPGASAPGAGTPAAGAASGSGPKAGTPGTNPPATAKPAAGEPAAAKPAAEKPASAPTPPAKTTAPAN